MANQQTHESVVAATAATEATMRTQTVPVNVWEAPEAIVVVSAPTGRNTR